MMRDLFDRAAALVRERAPATFDQWFGGVQFDDLTDGVLSLRARNEFVLEWVRDNYLPALVEELRALTGGAVEVAWTLDPELRDPVAVAPASPPVRPRPVAVRAMPPAPESAPRLREAPLPAGVSGHATFASFIVGPSNALAHAAALSAAGGGGRRANPLFLCGGTGLGKTHLLHAVANRVRSERPEARIVYATAESFTNDFVGALQRHDMAAFRERYRGADVLLVDDVQFLAGREQTQEEFFHTFNALHAADRPIVVTSDVYPRDLAGLAERLTSRFAWGLVADVQAPELETRIAILRARAAAEGLVLADEVALLLAQTVRANVRELEGALVRLAAKSSLLGRPIDLDFARAELAAVGAPARPTSIDAIQRVVEHHFHVRDAELTGAVRSKGIAFARHIAMYLCKVRLAASYPEIGRAFGNRDHTTVMAAVRKIEAARESDPQVRAHVDALTKRLEAA